MAFSTLQHTATHCHTLQHSATHCEYTVPIFGSAHGIQHTAIHCNTLPHSATHCSTLQLTVTYCNTLRHTATQCNTLSHTQYQYLAVLMAFSTAAPYRLPAYSNKWLNFNLSVAVLASLLLTFAVEGRGLLSFVSLSCIELQCVAVCCSVLKSVAVYYSV